MNLDLLPYVCILTVVSFAFAGIMLFVQIQSSRWRIRKIRENEEQGKYDGIDEDWNYGWKAKMFAFTGIYNLILFGCILPAIVILILEFPELLSSPVFWGLVSVPIVVSFISGSWVYYQIYFPK